MEQNVDWTKMPTTGRNTDQNQEKRGLVRKGETKVCRKKEAKLMRAECFEWQSVGG